MLEIPKKPCLFLAIYLAENGSANRSVVPYMGLLFPPSAPANRSPTKKRRGVILSAFQQCGLRSAGHRDILKKHKITKGRVSYGNV